MKILPWLFLCLSFNVFAQNNSSIIVNTKVKQFDVSLDANPTTGYQWSIVTYDKKLFSLTKSQFQKPQTRLIGAVGKMVFHFNIRTLKSYPQYSDMVFKYARAWEPKSGEVKKLRVYLK